MIKLLDLHKKYEFVIGFKSKTNTKEITEQDKKHIRLLAILQLIRDKQIQYLLEKEFDEKFIYDKKSETAYYCVKLKRKEGSEECRQSLVN